MITATKEHTTPSAWRTSNIRFIRLSRRGFEMGEHRGPEFIPVGDKSKNEPYGRIRCPIHGFIRFSENEKRIIDSAYVRRLRHIRQLGLTEYVYPGANHTRFEHSLGVMHTATLMFDSLAAKKGETMENELKSLPWFNEAPLAKARQVVRLAGLLHDTGHAPFSHAAEKVFHDDGHEQESIRIVTEKLDNEIDTAWGPGTANQVAKLLKKDDPEPQLRFLKQIISGELDADRTDYLLRDSHHCGVEYGRFDYIRLIESLTLWQLPAGGLDIAIDRGGIHTVEALILARFQMSAQVYYHRIRRIYDYLLVKYFEEVKKEGALPTGDFVDLNDAVMMQMLFEDAKKVDGSARARIAKQITERNHPKWVFETGDNADTQAVRKANEVLQELKGKFEAELILDGDKKPMKLHRFSTTGSQEEEEFELKVIDGLGNRTDFGAESILIRPIPKSFRCVRIFADNIDKSKQKEMREEANSLWRKA